MLRIDGAQGAVSMVGSRHSSMEDRAKEVLCIIDDHFLDNQKFVLAVDPTQEALLEQEDLDHDGLITIDDGGPKVQC